MEVYQGITAISDFRRAKILSKLSRQQPTIAHVDAEFVHFVKTTRPLTKTESGKLESLIRYGVPYDGKRDGMLFLVIPRSGTISPWSSKATDILHNCGLTHITRIERGIAYYVKGAHLTDYATVAAQLHDRMTEIVVPDIKDSAALFGTAEPSPMRSVDIMKNGLNAIEAYNTKMGLALSTDEMKYIATSFHGLRRNPTDVELMMFAQLNSEHCRHKIFNASWTIDGKKQPKSLFDMIKNTNLKNSHGVLSAYVDNGAVLKGPNSSRFFARPDRDGMYGSITEPVHTVIKVETHNHPTAIAPVPGAATGTGGEIRDEAATGRGAKSKMGMAGFTVSNLEIPGNIEPWELGYGKPGRIASPLDIMIEAPIGAASFANEFGRPALSGYFRTFEQHVGGNVWGYHKPIMIAGGLGNIRANHVHKQELPAGSYIVVLGGPAMLIGLGGGAASSMQSGTSSSALDFASVQRGNGEMERRAQEVIDSCWALGEKNPIKAIHDVGAGGWSVSIPELVKDNNAGAKIELRDLPNAEPGMSPMQIWCNESQERYVLTIDVADLKQFEKFCERERCPFSVVGKLTSNSQLIVSDSLFQNKPVDIAMEVLLGKPPKMERSFASKKTEVARLPLRDVSVDDGIKRVLRLPAVGSKQFLITIGDRTVGGLTVRDQMVGPWQVPVSDVAVTATSFATKTGEAMTVGERTPLAVLNPSASARMAVGEALTNILSADIEALSDVKLSANWMAAVGFQHEDQHLYESVKSIGEDFCPALGLSIPVGKDSLSMRSTWKEGQTEKSVTSPMSVIITAFSGVADVSKTLTPYMRQLEDTCLLYIDLGKGKNRLGGSALAQVFNLQGGEAPDIEPHTLKSFIALLRTLKNTDQIMAYHDRSDGGLLATVLEMAFASRSGLRIDLSEVPGSTLEKLFSEELGAVIQVKEADKDLILHEFSKVNELSAYDIGHPTKEQTILITDNGNKYQYSRAELESLWNTVSYAVQKLRDNTACADEEHVLITEDNYAGLTPKVLFTPTWNMYKTRPKVAVMREEGVNGHVEMAAAFDRAGFTAVDVHLNDLLIGTKTLKDYRGIIACGGFSYGDVLGAGEGWAKSILFHSELKSSFTEFFARKDCFSFGVCNGCQMFVALKKLIPGAEYWPDVMLKNRSEQFEARLVQTIINKTPSILFSGMEGSVLPIPVAHGEGRTQFSGRNLEHAQQNNLIVGQFVDGNHEVTEQYPANPNGSIEGVAAMTSTDGRSTIIMPHPERVFLSQQLSWHPDDWEENSPWFQLFCNAREWVR